MSPPFPGALRRRVGSGVPVPEPAGRVCAQRECGTVLSIYNPSDRHAVHDVLDEPFAAQWPKAKPRQVGTPR